MGFRFQIRRVEEPHHLSQQKPFGENCKMFKKIDQLKFLSLSLAGLPLSRTTIV